MCVPFFSLYGTANVVQTEHSADRMQRAKLPTEWVISKDEHMARNIVSGLESESDNWDPSKSAAQPLLCAKCQDVQSDLWQPFSVSYETEYLRDSAQGSACHLCKFFFQTWQTHVADHSSSVLVERSGSWLKVNGKPVLSLFRSFGMSLDHIFSALKLDHSIQIRIRILRLSRSTDQTP